MKKLVLILSLTLLPILSFAAGNAVVQFNDNEVILEVNLNQRRFAVNCINQEKSVLDAFGDVSRIDGASNTHLNEIILTRSNLTLSYSISGDGTFVPRNINVPLDSNCK